MAGPYTLGCERSVKLKRKAFGFVIYQYVVVQKIQFSGTNLIYFFHEYIESKANAYYITPFIISK